MKKLAIVAFIASLAYAQSVSTDWGSKTAVNHSAGVLTYDFGKLQTAKCVANPDGGSTCVNKYSATLNYHTSAAVWPTTFVPYTNFYDAGCQRVNLAETPTPISPRVVGKALFCQIDRPINAADAGTVSVFKHIDGGYVAEVCPSYAAISSEPWPALCTMQNGPIP